METEEIKTFNELTAHVVDLIEKSESRIDRVNDMILKLVNVMEKLTNEYITQLEALKNSRDSALKQVSETIALCNKLQSDIEHTDKRYDALLDKVFLLNSTRGSSENNINVRS